MSNVLEFRSVRLAFGRTIALADINLDIREGEVLALLGPNGAGKTCSLQLAAGLLVPSSGQVDSSGLASRRAVGYCPQTCAVWDNLRVDEQVALVAAFYGITGRTAREHSAELFKEFALEKESRKLARELSRGKRRKLNLVLSLIHAPAFLILDEPEAELDIESKAALIDLLERMAARGGKTIVFSTHSPAVAFRLADRIAVLKEGLLIACGPPSDFASSGSSIEKAYLDLIGGGA